MKYYDAICIIGTPSIGRYPRGVELDEPFGYKFNKIKLATFNQRLKT